MRDYSDVSDFDNCKNCGKIECECNNESEYEETICENHGKGFKPILISISVFLGLLFIGKNLLPYSNKK